MIQVGTKLWTGTQVSLSHKDLHPHSSRTRIAANPPQPPADWPGVGAAKGIAAATGQLAARSSERPLASESSIRMTARLSFSRQ